MNTAELNNSSFDLLPLFPALGIILLLGQQWRSSRASCDRCCIAKCESEYDEARHKRGRALSR